MAKKFFYICAGILMLTICAAIGFGMFEIRTQRYVVFTGSKYPIKMDTKTGESWVAISESVWSPIIQRSDNQKVTARPGDSR
jgi:hypothetical protein